MKEEHIPVLLTDVIEALHIAPGKKYIDATVGLGGHTREIVAHGGIVLGIDRDGETIGKLRVKSEELRVENLTLVQGSFARIKTFAEEKGFTQVSGILMDLGYSSWQLDQSGRGFSFAKDEPLDMRYDLKTQEITAADVVNSMSPDELLETISTLGEEERAQKIVYAITRARPIQTTAQLVKALEKAVPYERERHLARIFQALRIAVNNELGAIKKALPEAVSLLKPGGRLAVISFHSLEDRIIKQFYKDNEKTLKTITKKPITATWEETKRNSRARSAKLRVAEKL